MNRICAALVLLMLSVGCTREPAKPAAPTADAAANAVDGGLVSRNLAPVIVKPPDGALPASMDAFTQRPLYYTRELTEADLAGRSLRELSLMRNWIYARAGNTFRKEWLAKFFQKYDWYRPREQQDLSVLTGYDKKNAAKISAAEAAFTEDALLEKQRALVEVLRKDEGYPNDPKHPDAVIELSLVAARVGTWVEPKPGVEAASPLEDPKRLNGLLTLADLEDLSRRDLRILRNMVYARHGRPFKSEVLHEYFTTLDWYQPDEKYTDGRLSAVDRKNVQLIQSVENEIGGALSDHEHLMEEEGATWLGVA